VYIEIYRAEPRWRLGNQNAGGHVTVTYPSKAQALCAAIELAEREAFAATLPKFLSAMRIIAS
jgi:hypothetical protein